MKILLIQLKRVGDVIVTTPVIEAVHRRFPDAAIDFMTDKSFAPLLEHHPYLRRVQKYDRAHLWDTLRQVRNAQYDVIFDFQGSPRSAMLVLWSGARLRAGYEIGFWQLAYNKRVPRPRGAQLVTEGKFSLLEHVWGPLGERPPRMLCLTEEEKSWADRAILVEHGQKVVGLVPPDRRESRRWPDASFAEVARRQLSAGHAVWLFWGPGEESLVKSVADRAPGSVMIPKTSLRQMAALLARCKLVVTNDCGPMHLATAVGTPTVTLYGPTDPANWNPGGSKNTVLQAPDVPCLKCNLNECPINHECMTHLTPERVLSACQPYLC